VIALFNVPHTPQHNPFVERAFGDLKCASRLDELVARGADSSQALVCVPDAGVSNTCELLRERLCATRDALDRTPRLALRTRTPAEVDGSAERAEDRACRARFYADARAALARVAAQPLKPRARRRAEREAILCTLETHGLVRRTRGDGRKSRPS
jgi:hypothetical protein